MSRGKITLYKLVVLGDGGVGKTALTIQLCWNHFVETYDPTIEDSYRKQIQIDGHSCMLEVLDTAGQEEYTVLRDQWIRDGEGFVLVYSISSRSTFTTIKQLHHQIQKVKESTAASLGPAPVIIVGNKCDRVGEREVSIQDGSALAKELNCGFVEASAKERINVEEAYYHVVRRLHRQRARVQSRQTTHQPAGESGRLRLKSSMSSFAKSFSAAGGNNDDREKGYGPSRERLPVQTRKCVIL